MCGVYYVCGIYYEWRGSDWYYRLVIFLFFVRMCVILLKVCCFIIKSNINVIKRWWIG